MAKCLNPLKGYSTPDGISFSKPEGPVMYLPCGQCMGCRLCYAETWGVRMTHEAKTHDESCFITLTYDDQNLPEDSSLNYEHTRAFIKRLRKVLSRTQYKNKMRYFISGEYGDNFSRPHYHACIFGFDFSAPIEFKGKINDRKIIYKKNGNTFYESSLLTDLWGKGICNLSHLNYASARYTASYVVKKVNGSLKDTHYQGRTQERAFMSTRPALGSKWLETFYTDIYPHDDVILDQKHLKVPRYYDKWLEKHHPDLYLSIKMKREAEAIQFLDDTALTNSYEVGFLAQKAYSNELKGSSPTNILDAKIIAYKRNQADYDHFRKKHAKNVHCV